MDLRQAAVGAASPLPRGRSSNIALADPNPAAGPAWGPSRWGAADVHPELLLCLLLALLLVHRPAQHMQRLSHASSSRGAYASSLCAIMHDTYVTAGAPAAFKIEHGTALGTCP